MSNKSRHPHGNSPARKQQRREEAAKRQEIRDGRTAKQQLARLDKMFGKGKGAARERARLEAAK